jgi:hypothetical protein
VKGFLWKGELLGTHPSSSFFFSTVNDVLGFSRCLRSSEPGDWLELVPGLAERLSSRLSRPKLLRTGFEGND